MDGENNFNITLKRRDTIQCVINFWMLCAQQIKDLEQIYIEYNASFNTMQISLDGYMYSSLFLGPLYWRYHIHQIDYIGITFGVVDETFMNNCTSYSVLISVP